ncbi:right-handed parallel beta-helix repeat-containing protein [Planomicrobium sp. YIM 101495]|uniref:right-handed parallel beta-helix repeat-containing protein n=1 Tax=Planomicrobium sp. YIM 101495 TaxID=2665160 RepID=UPI001E623D0B|nr:right-handed parallel beta-helix repeat-containing protein [Planomicrobium sp. YIM 101495]
MKKTAAIFLAIIVILILLFIGSNAEQQRHLYVSPDGSDGQDGSLGNPLRTLQEAASRAAAGTIVHVRGGVYEEGLVVQHSGTESEPVVFRAYEGEEVVLSGADFESREGDTALVAIEDQNYVEIRGFTLQDLTTELADETVMGIFVSGSSSHIVLGGNRVRRIGTQSAEGNAHGIAVYGTGAMTDITVIDNVIEDLTLGASEALVLNGNIDGFEITDNVVRRCDNIGIDLIGHEGVSPEMDYVRNGIVSGNEVYEISSFGNPAYGNDYSAGGIYVDGGKDIRIENNEVHHNDIGIEASSEHAGEFAERIEIVGNAVYENIYTGIAIGVKSAPVTNAIQIINYNCMSINTQSVESMVS